MFTGVWTTNIKKINVKIDPSVKPNRFYEICNQNTSAAQLKKVFLFNKEI